MNTAIKIKNLTVSYSNIEAVNNISLNINKGEFVCIIGPNGGGKTTLLNTILGFIKPSSGTIEIDRKNMLSYVPQVSLADRSFPISVLETVLTAFLKSGLHPFKSYTTDEKQKALALLKLMGIEQYAENQISELSGGEFQRLLIARALAAEPQILLLDEPTANVDAISRNKVFETLKELNQNGLTVIAVTHDISAALNHSTKLAVINRDLIYSGAPVINDDIAQIMYGGAIPYQKGEI